MKKYRIERQKEGVYLTFIDGSSARTISPYHSRAIRNHASNFEWISASGACQLALAIMFDYTKDKRVALPLYQEFKLHFIAPLRGNLHEITSDDIDRWVTQQASKIKEINFTDYMQP